MTFRTLTRWGTIALAASFPFGAFGQQPVDPMAATVAQWFSLIERQFVALADAMPAEKYGFKPTNGEFNDVRTFGEQVKPVACANFGFFNEIEKKEPPARCGEGGQSPAKTKATSVTESGAVQSRLTQ